MASRPLWLLLLTSLLVAGCSVPAADLADLPVADPVSGTEGDDAPPERWYGFDFAREVTPRTGAAGKIESYTARISEEEGGKVTTFDLKVEVLETSTIDIRTKRVSFSEAYEYKEEIVSTPLEVTEFKHTITIVKDDTGEHEPGTVSVIHGFTPTDPEAEQGVYLFGFARMSWIDEEGNPAVLEYYVTPEQQASGASHLPYQEGEADFGGHWGNSLFGMALSPTWLTAWTDGTQSFEEGEWSFGGYSYRTERKPLAVSGLGFDGWRVEWSAAADGATSVWMFEVATSLPIPFAYKFGGSDAGAQSSSHWTYELRELALG